MSPARAHVGLLVCVALWALIFIGVHQLLDDGVDAVQIVTLRFLLVSAVFLVLLAAWPAQRPHLSRREWVAIVISGLAAVPGSQLAIVYAQNFLSPPLASMIITSSPAFAAVMALWLLREPLGARQVTGLVIALAGVALIVGLGAGSGAALHVSNPGRAAVAIITPVTWALYTVLSKPIATAHPSTGAVGVAVIAGSVPLLALLPHSLHAVGGLSAGDWAWLVYLAIGGTIAPYILWFASLRSLPVGRTAAFMYLIPVFAIGWTVLFLGKLPGVSALGGGVLVVAGVALTQLRAVSPRAAAARRRARSPVPPGRPPG